MRFLRKIFSPKIVEHFEVVRPLKRPVEFQEEIQVRIDDVKSLVKYLHNEWERGKVGEDHVSTYVIDRKDVAGIVTKVIGCNCMDHYELLQEYIKNRLEKIGYITYVNRHICEKENGTCRERFVYFLKPKPSFAEGKYDQKFGNILMELKQDLKDSFHFKLQANYYQGFNYSEPISFDALLELFDYD
jgi:glutamate racemase